LLRFLFCASIIFSTMATDFPTTELTPGDPNRPLTPAEITEFEQQKLALLNECDRIAMTGSLALWQLGLQKRFGFELGEQLAAQEVTEGMTLEHLTASFGVADQREEDGPVTTYIYGNKKTGSYFDVRDGIITAAHIKGLPLPPVPLSS
jgi:hypothetical protein